MRAADAPGGWVGEDDAGMNDCSHVGMVDGAGEDLYCLHGKGKMMGEDKGRDCFMKSNLLFFCLFASFLFTIASPIAIFYHDFYLVCQRKNQLTYGGVIVN